MSGRRRRQKTEEAEKRAGFKVEAGACRYVGILLEGN